MIAGNVRQSLARYRDLDSGWSWDLAYYNQWFWALTQGRGMLSVRPLSNFGREGESIWRGNYLAPIRLAIAPFYAIRPGPETLLVAEAVFFWIAIPATFVLALGESRRIGVALTAACLVPLTPLSCRSRRTTSGSSSSPCRSPRWRWKGCGAAALADGIGVGGLLACRQEFAAMVAMLAIAPPREPEDLGRTVRWARGLFGTGLA